MPAIPNCKIPWPLSLLIGAAFSLALTGCGASVTTGSFTLAATPSTLVLTAGQQTQLTVNAVPSSGFNQPVNVTLSNVPPSVTATPSTLVLTPGAAQSFTLSAGADLTLPPTRSLTINASSGSITRTATVSLAVFTPAPLPSFTLSTAPASLSITAGGAAASLSVLATAQSGFTGAVAVSASGLPAGVTVSPTTLNLQPGTAQAVSLVAGAGATPATGTVVFTGTSGTFNASTSLALTVQPPAPQPAATGPDVPTYHFDNTRQGLNPQETILTPANVNATSFGLLGNYPVDGKVDAEPLYIGGLTFPVGSGTQIANALFIATEHDSVYALNPTNGQPFWRSSVLAPGETTSDPRGCDQVSPEIGITSTPVIDRAFGAHGAIFVVADTKDSGGAYHQRLHALDLTTGAELPGSPSDIAATYPGTGIASNGTTNTFDPAQYVERAALLLLNHTLYLTFSSHCDIEPYQGWVMGYSEQTLQQTAVLDLTPNGSEGSVWMSGYGMAADSAGNIYLLDANGTLDSSFTGAGFPAQGDYGNAILKLSTAGGTLAVNDFFEPYNTVDESANDLDLGSGGAMLLPDLTDNQGLLRQLVMGGGKDDNFYIADRNNLGKYDPNANNGNLYQELPNAFPNKLYAGPAYYNNAIYVAGVGDVLKAFSIQNARLSPTPSSQSAAVFPYPGSTPSISANGNRDGIVWALESPTNGPAVLHAYDPANLGHELYNSTQAPNNRDSFGLGNKFLTPTISNGMVFVGTPNSVAVFGLR